MRRIILILTRLTDGVLVMVLVKNEKVGCVSLRVAGVLSGLLQLLFAVTVTTLMLTLFPHQLGCYLLTGVNSFCAFWALVLVVMCARRLKLGVWFDTLLHATLISLWVFAAGAAFAVISFPLNLLGMMSYWTTADIVNTVALSTVYLLALIYQFAMREIVTELIPYVEANFG